MPENMRIGDVFWGACKAENGKLIPLDEEIIYNTEENVLEYREWIDKNGRDCLTVVVPCREI